MPLSKKVYLESRVMQFMFLVILGCHIPFLFFSGKEALLNIVDELYRRNISKSLTYQLDNENLLVKTRES